MPTGFYAKQATISNYAPTTTVSGGSSLGNSQRGTYTKGSDSSSSLGNSGR